MGKRLENKDISVARVLTGLLTNGLKTSANSASCAFVYQPKEPAGIEKFKKRERV